MAGLPENGGFPEEIYQIEPTDVVQAGPGGTANVQGAQLAARTRWLKTAVDGKAPAGHTHAFGDLAARPTTLAGYGITDAAPAGHTHAFGTLAGRPTTLAGYGINDAAPAGHTHAFGELAARPTTLAGYGITDAVPAGALQGRRGALVFRGSDVSFADVLGTAVAVPWDGESFDTDGCWGAGLPTRLAVPVNGVFFVFWHLLMQHTGNVNGAADLYVLRNGAIRCNLSQWPANGGHMSGFTVIEAAQGDFVELVYSNPGAGTYTFKAGRDVSCFGLLLMGA